MRKRFAAYGWLGVALLAAGAAGAQQPTVTAAKHPFGAKDWSALHSAHAAAVSPDGTILYRVIFGGDKGPTHTEWWTIGADGSHAAKLDLQEDFSPMGFTIDGRSLYGGWKVKDQQQLAVFPVADHKAATVPSTLVLLPRGIASAVASPDGKHFAVVADPRSPDPLGDVRHVQEPGESSVYVVNADGTGGRWWCSNLKSVDPGNIAWNAEGSSFAALSPVPHIGHHEVAASVDVCSAQGAQHVADIPNSVSGIAWAEGGTQLAFLSTKTETLTPEHVWTVSAAGGTATDRTPVVQGTVVELKGDPQGRVWVAVAHGVQNDVEEFREGVLVPVYRRKEGTIEGVPATSLYPHTSEQIALTVHDPSHAANVAVPEGDHLRKITTEGDAQLAAVDLGPVRTVRWKSKEGIALEGIATFPGGYVGRQEASVSHSAAWWTRGQRSACLRFFDPDRRGVGVHRAAAGVSRLDRLRSRLPGGDLSALWRPCLSGCRQRDRLRDRPGLGRPAPPGDLRLERRRLHDVLDGDADEAISSSR
jgi:hypothetical protein